MSNTSKILVIHASPRGKDSLSQKAGDLIVAKLQKLSPGSEVQTLNISEDSPPHVTYPLIGAYFTPESDHSPEQKKEIQLSDRLTNQALSADYIVISTPMWNFTVPSSLKAWIDHISRAGKTFAFTEQGPKGLLKTKKVFVAVASGSVFSEGPFQAYDLVAPYLRTIFGFLGVQNVEIVRIEGVNDPKNVAHAFTKTEKQIEQLSL